MCPSSRYQLPSIRTTYSIPCAVPLTRPLEPSYTRPILPRLSSPVSFHRYRETGEIFRLPSGRRDSTGGTLICPPRIKATACEILSLALETRLFELAKLDATRETLISQPGGYGAREEEAERITTMGRHKARNVLTKESARVGRRIYPAKYEEAKSSSRTLHRERCIFVMSLCV